MNWSSSWPDNPESSIFIGMDKGSDDRGSMAVLSIKNGQKTVEMIMEVVGDLALDYSDDGWNIYHVPTLALFSKAVPGYNVVKANWDNEAEFTLFEYDRKQLLRWMAKVQTNYQTAWTMLRLLTPENYADKGQSAKDIILKWCLSVKVE